jgi:outer membrane protein assembly factor BamB
MAALALGASIMAMPAAVLAQDQEQTFPDVPMYRVDPAHRTIDPGPGPAGKPGVVWSIPTGPGHEHQPILHQGTLLYGTFDGRVLAVDPATGTERWTWQGDGEIGDLAASDGRVFARDGAGVIRALDVATGQELWSTGKEITTSSGRITFGDGVLYAADADGNVYGIDPATGDVTWSWDGPVPIRSLTVVNGAGYFGGNDGRLFSVSVADGTERWRPVQLLFPNVGSSGLVDGWLYVSSNQGSGPTGGELYAIDAATGVVHWRFRTPSGGFIGSSSVADGIAYSATEGDGLYALDARTGAQLWHADGRTWYAVPAIVGETLYLASPDGFLTAYDRADGRQLWEVPIGGGNAIHLAISGGLIFLGDGAGTLMAFGDGPTSAASQPAGDRPTAEASQATGSLAAIMELLATWDATTIDGLDHPTSMAVGPDGNLYVVNALKDEILVLDADGNVVRRWGRTGSTDGTFDFLRDPGDPFSVIGGVAASADGSVYVADAANHRIQKFGPVGDFRLSWGTFGDGDGQFLDPIDLAVGPDGTVYVVDDVRDDIQRFTPDGKYLQTIGRHGSGDGELTNTGGIAVGSDGTLYNADFGNYRVQAWDADGDFLWSLGSRGSGPGRFASFPGDVALDDAGRLFVTEGWRVHAFDADQWALGLWSVPGATGDDGGLGPIAVLPDGSVVVGDHAKDLIYKLRLAE